MKVFFIGTGDPFDPERGTSATVVKSDKCLLIDCGYQAVAKLLPRLPDPNAIDGIYFTHGHADHLLGAPGLLCWMYHLKRTRPLKIFGQIGTQAAFERVMDLGYAGLRGILPFDLTYEESDSRFELGSLRCSLAPTEHGAKNLAIRVDCNGTSVGISGDGRLTDESQALFAPVQLLIHDCYVLSGSYEGHASAAEVLSFADTLKDLKTLALVHVDILQRGGVVSALPELQRGRPFQVIFPDSGDEWSAGDDQKEK